jgi:rhodanese-related sulfurtransferase
VIIEEGIIMTTNQKKSYHIIVFILFGLILAGFIIQCDRLNRPFSTEQQEPTHLYLNITPAEAFTLIQTNQNNPDFLIIDVRTPVEYNNGHIENAINIDFYSNSFRDELDQLDKNLVILIYCRSSNRSSNALVIMEELGFKEVYNMLQGINGWITAGYPVV